MMCEICFSNYYFISINNFYPPEINKYSNQNMTKILLWHFASIWCIKNCILDFLKGFNNNWKNPRENRQKTKNYYCLRLFYFCFLPETVSPNFKNIFFLFFFEMSFSFMKKSFSTVSVVFKIIVDKPENT